MRIYKKFLRQLVITLIVVSAIFGLVIVIYESSQFYHDSLAEYLPNNTEVYLHLQRSADNNRLVNYFLNLDNSALAVWQRQWQLVNDLPWQEVGWFSFQNKEGNTVYGWLVLLAPESVEELSKYNLPLDLNFYQHSNLLLLVNDPTLDKVSFFSPASDNLGKFLRKNIKRERVDDYLFIKDGSKYQSFIMSLLGEDLSWQEDSLAGKWLLVLSDKSVRLRLLDQPPRFDFYLPRRGVPRWLRAFADKPLIFYQASAADLFSAAKMITGKDWDYLLTSWRQKYGPSLKELLSYWGRIDLVIDISLDKPLSDFWRQHRYNWLAEIDWGDKQDELLKKVISAELGYLSPQEKVVQLPDGSQATVWQASKVPFDYQIFTWEDKPLQIVYFDSASYFFIYPISKNRAVIGNSLDLLSQYVKPLFYFDFWCDVNQGKIKRALIQQNRKANNLWDNLAIFELEKGGNKEFLACFR